MRSMNTFEPDWTCPPGATVLDLLSERGLTMGQFAEAAHVEPTRASRLVYGLEPLTQDWAESLARTLGSSPSFWLRREEVYRQDLERLCAVPHAGGQDWLGEVPVNDLVRFGWINSGGNKHETALNTCAFFGVTSAAAFERRYAQVVAAAAYRTSTACEARAGSVAAWLRQGEIEAAEIDCAHWNERAVHDSLGELRELTREPDPAHFLPRVREVLAGCGVAFVVARLPEGCRASGAARFVSSNRALVQLSFRYLNDDQFWFTLFHELGHLLLHTHGELFLEGIEARHPEAETQADEFAEAALFERVGVAALADLPPNKFAIARLARRAGVAPGLIVGRLQSRGRVPFKHFNYMKVRYAWVE